MFVSPIPPAGLAAMVGKEPRAAKLPGLHRDDVFGLIFGAFDGRPRHAVSGGRVFNVSYWNGAVDEQSVQELDGLHSLAFSLAVFQQFERRAFETLAPYDVLRRKVVIGQPVLAQQVLEPAAALADVRGKADELSRRVFAISLCRAQNDPR